MAIFGRSFPSHPIVKRAPVVPFVPPVGGPVALDGVISCQLRFNYAAGGSPNDASPLTVAHTLQGSITDALIFTYASGGGLTDSSSLTVAHTLTGNIVTQVNIVGGSNLAITTQSSVACLAVLSAQLAVAHTLQGSVVDVLSFLPFNDTAPLTIVHSLEGSIAAILTVRDSFFTVAHTLGGRIDDSLGITIQTPPIQSDGSITITGNFTGSLSVAHSLQSLIDCYCSLDQTGILCREILVGSLTVAHALKGLTIGQITLQGDLTIGQAPPPPAAQGTAASSLYLNVVDALRRAVIVDARRTETPNTRRIVIVVGPLKRKVTV